MNAISERWWTPPPPTPLPFPFVLFGELRYLRSLRLTPFSPSIWPLIALRRALNTPNTAEGRGMLTFSQSSEQQVHYIFGSSILSSHFVGILKGTALHLSQSWDCRSPQLTYSKLSLPQVRQHGNLLKSSCLETTLSGLSSFPLPQSAPLHRHPDILKVHHSHYTPRRAGIHHRAFHGGKQRKCQVLYWWGIHSDCHWARRSWVLGSGDATELENGPNHVLQSKEYSLAGTQQGAFCPHANTLCRILV